MKLIKLMNNTDTFVIVTDELIKLGDYYINTDSSNPYGNKKIFRATPLQLDGKGFKEPNYFKNWMRKIIASTITLKGVNTVTVEEMESFIKKIK